MDLSHIAICHDLTEQDFVQAAQARETAYELLNHLSVICEPHTGEERMLSFLARCALQDWVDGALRVEVRLEGLFECHVVLMGGLGGDAFDVLKRVFVSASFLAFKQLAEDPAEIAPLTLTQVDAKRIVLDTDTETLGSGSPPASLAEAMSRIDQKMMLPGGTPEPVTSERDAACREPPEVPEVPPELPLVTSSEPSEGGARALARIQLAKRPIRAAIVEVQPPAEELEDGSYRVSLAGKNEDGAEGEGEASGEASDEAGSSESPEATTQTAPPAKE